MWDADGNKHIDYIGSLGANTLGYNHPKVNEAILQQLNKGCTHSLPTTLELDVAEKVKEMFPFVEKLRFFKTGSEACSAAVRVARAYTDRGHILVGGYSGWHDMFTFLTEPALGVKDKFKVGRIPNDINDFSPKEDIAAVRLEPVELDHSEKRKDYLKKLRQDCTDNGSLLIFDEIITGGRWPNWSVSKDWKIEPDLICLGKGLANGMPLAILGGRAEVMDSSGEWFCSGTFNGETLSLAAGLATMEVLQKSEMAYLWQCGRYFQEKFNELHKDVQLVGYPTRCIWEGDRVKIFKLWQEAANAGILFGRAFFYNFTHIDQTDYTLSICSSILDKIDNVELRGRMPQWGFKK